MKQLLENWRRFLNEDISNVEFPELKTYTFSELDRFVFNYDIFDGIETEYVLKNWEVFIGCVFKIPRQRKFIIMTPDGDFMDSNYDTVDVRPYPKLKFLQDQENPPENFDQIRGEFEMITEFPKKLSNYFYPAGSDIHHLIFMGKKLPDVIDAKTLKQFDEVVWKNQVGYRKKPKRGPVPSPDTFVLFWANGKEEIVGSEGRGSTFYFKQYDRTKIDKPFFDVIKQVFKR